MEENFSITQPSPILVEQNEVIPTSSKPPRFSKWMIVSFIGIAVLCIVAGLFSTFFKNTNIHSEKKVMLTKKITPTPLLPVSSNWKTYINTPYRFSIKQPNLSEKGSICGMLPIPFTDFKAVSFSSMYHDTPNSCDYFNYFINIYISTKDKTIKGQIEEIKDLLGFTDQDVRISQIMIGKTNVTKMVLLKKLPTGSEPKASNYWLPFNNEYYFFFDPSTKNVYTILAHYDQQKYANSIDAIVSTFAILPPQATSTAQLPIYTYFPKEAFSTTDYVKRNYNKEDLKGYISTDYYAVLDSSPDANLVDFQCSYSMYLDSRDMVYHYRVHNKEKNESKEMDIPIGSQIAHILNNDPRSGFRDLRYCVTSDNKEYTLATGEKGLTLSQIDQNTAKTLATDTSIKDPYFGCDNILAITKDNKFYISCGGGDTTTYTSIRKVDGNTGEMKKIIECLTPEEGEMKCTTN